MSAPNPPTIIPIKLPKNREGRLYIRNHDDGLELAFRDHERALIVKFVLSREQFENLRAGRSARGPGWLFNWGKPAELTTDKVCAWVIVTEIHTCACKRWPGV